MHKLTLNRRAVKSNLEDAKMSDEELAGQMTVRMSLLYSCFIAASDTLSAQTMVLAGSETTAATLAWALHTLADRPEMAQQLREEVKIAQSKARDDGREELSYDEVDHLPVLDAICVSCMSSRFRRPLLTHPHLKHSARSSACIRPFLTRSARRAARTPSPSPRPSSPRRASCCRLSPSRRAPSSTFPYMR